MKSKFRITFFIVAISLFLIGCSINQNTEETEIIEVTASPTISATSTQTAIPSSNLITRTPTPLPTTYLQL